MAGGRIVNYVEIAIQKLAPLLYALCVDDCVYTAQSPRGRESVDTMAACDLADTDGESNW